MYICIYDPQQLQNCWKEKTKHEKITKKSQNTKSQKNKKEIYQQETQKKTTT